jgi:hypothetical protein
MSATQAIARLRVAYAHASMDEDDEITRALPKLLECASVLADIAAQKTGAELDEDQYEHADFEGGYGIVIDKARLALQALAEGGE